VVTTRELWAKQDQHEGDRWRLFTAVALAVKAENVLYPGSFVDIAPSFVWPSVTYIDMDRRANRFFADDAEVRAIIAEHDSARAGGEISFVPGDYGDEHDLPDSRFDLLISLYAGFISEHCTRYLRIGGTLLVNASHGDAAMASIDDRYRLRAVVTSSGGEYRVRHDDLASYLVPTRPTEITVDALHRSGRGVRYTKSPFAYLFERVC
jgi:hypothetical protein